MLSATKSILAAFWFMRLAQKACEQDRGAGKRRSHGEARRETAGTFREDAGNGRASDLANPEYEGDEAESGEGFVRTHILADGGNHNGRDGPGHDAKTYNGNIQKKMRQGSCDQEICQHLKCEDDHEACLPAEPVRQRAEDRPGEKAQEADPGPEVTRNGLRKTAFPDQGRDDKGGVNDIGIAEEKVNGAEEIQGPVRVNALLG